MSNEIGIGGPGRLAGKVAVIAGAGGGMGSATPLRFAREGARVLLVARRATPLYTGRSRWQEEKFAPLAVGWLC